jgi:hypothetical protein
MSRRNGGSVVVWNSATPVAVTSSTDATPIVVTATAHLLVTGDLVQINGHTTNIAANGIFRITKVDANSYSLQDLNTGEDIAGSGAGAGASGVMVVAPRVIFVKDWRNIILSVETSGSFNGTFKIGGSIGKLKSDDTTYQGTTPNFGATQSKSNPYTFIQIINLDTAAAVNGATGVTSAGTDLHNMYEVNVNGLTYVAPVFTAWTAGTVTVKAELFDNL